MPKGKKKSVLETITKLVREADLAEAEEASLTPEHEAIAPAQEQAESQAAWYVVHCYSGYEEKVKKNLEQRIESMGMKDYIFDVLVPTEEVIEIREGQRQTVKRRIFPGYVLVKMIMNERSWYVVRNTPGVTGFVGIGSKPTPLTEEEVEKIMQRVYAPAPQVEVGFRPGERVRIIEGPFAEFIGIVDEIFPDKGKVRILLSFFGRETPVELDVLQVEKA
ncbi:MAG: transcription termination/antitermination protein NusG [Anaerolineae bacterium]|nr:transcription termination/antitermination protein NusG [Anaerolineae bacterium]